MVVQKKLIYRCVDELGRIVIPVDVRRNFGINYKDPLEIYVNGEEIVLQKPQYCCVFCQQPWSLRKFRGKIVCSHCIKDLQHAVYSPYTPRS